MDDDLLVTEGAGAEGVGQGPPLLGMGGGVADPGDSLILAVELIPLVLEEAPLPMLDVAVYVAVRLGGREGQGVRADSHNVA